MSSRLVTAVSRRVVITGAGCVSPYGRGVDTLWNSIKNNVSATRRLPRTPEEAARFPSGHWIAEALKASSNETTATEQHPWRPVLEKLSAIALVPHQNSSSSSSSSSNAASDSSAERASSVARGSSGDFDADGGRSLLPRDLKSAASPAFIRYAVSAALEAIQSAKLPLLALADDVLVAPQLDRSRVDTTRVGVSIGNAIGGVDHIEESAQLTSPRRVSPFYIPRILSNMAAGDVSIVFGCRGPTLSSSSACAAGAVAIGDAFHMIQRGETDIMISGGTESCITPLTLAGFWRAGALSTGFAQVPEASSRPFDSDRDGFVIGEGAAVLVLESLDSALARGLTEQDMIAEVVGYARSSDAFHITSPSSPDGDSGSVRCLESLLRNSGISIEEVDHINAHATSTPIGDDAEAAAIARVFGNHPAVVSSIKGHVGHLLGAAGAVEGLVAALSVRDAVAPGNLNLTHPRNALASSSAGGQIYSREAVPLSSTKRRVAISNSFGFGGTNSSLAFKSLKV